MALQATHLRIARDLAQHIKITDIDAYYRGTLYPDSRYRSKIARENTHGPDCPHNPFDVTLSDFEKGWAIHLLYDEISGEMQKALMPKDLVLSMNLDYPWAYFTAIKIVEDLFSVRALGEDLSVFKRFIANETPNNESIEHLHDHYQSLNVLYGTEIPSFEHHENQFLLMKIPEKIARDMRNVAEELERDEMMRQKIDEIYNKTFQEIKIFSQ